MATAPDPSERVEQRLRNRAIEALETLADGDEGVRSMGVGEYVDEFFDIIDDRLPGSWRTWSVFTPGEVHAPGVVHDLLVQACAETPQVPCRDLRRQRGLHPHRMAGARRPRPQPLT